jgi:hypothetical protein
MNTNAQIPAASTGDPVIDLAEKLKRLFDDIIAARKEASRARYEAEEAQQQAEDAARQAEAAGRRATEAGRLADVATRRAIDAERAVEEVLHEVTGTLRGPQVRE